SSRSARSRPIRCRWPRSPGTARPPRRWSTASPSTTVRAADHNNPSGCPSSACRHLLPVYGEKEDARNADDPSPCPSRGEGKGLDERYPQYSDEVFAARRNGEG